VPDQILYVHHASVLGGAEISLLELIRCLDRQRHQPAVMLPSQGPLAAALGELDTPVHIAPLRRLRRTMNPVALARYWSAMRATRRRLRDVLAQENISLVHCNSTTAQLFVGDVPLRRGVPCVWHVRDLRPLDTLQRRLERNATKVVAVSRAVAESLRSEKTVVVHNGVDVAKFCPHVSGAALRAELEIDHEAFVIGTAAQWVPWKRLDVFLAAAEAMAAAHPRCRFLVAGEDLFRQHPRLSADLRQAAATPPLRGKLHLLGHRADMPQVMAALDVFVLPSEREPFGRVLIEAMAAGRPVVAVRGGGPDDIVTPECGVLLDSADASALAAALERMIEHPELRARMARAARARTEAHFSTQRTAATIESIYEELLH